METYLIYSHADDRLYLAHHGVQGMHWGIRRFQPYGHGGYAREGGKTGKVVGEAKDLKKSYAKLNRTRTAVNVGSAAGATVTALAGSTVPTAAAVVTGNVGLAMVSLYTAPMASLAASGAILSAGQTKVEKLLKDSPIANEKIQITEGTTLKRTSLKQREDDDAGRLYAVLDKTRDLKYYEKNWPEKLRQISGNENAKVYQNTYKVNTTIVAPSLAERRKIAEAIVNADNKMKRELGEAYATQCLRIRTGKLGAENYKELKNSMPPSTREAVDKLYNDYKFIAIGDGKKKVDMTTDDDSFRRFTATLAKSPKLMNGYIKELQKQGYGAVFDDNSRQVADTPFIVFDPKVLTQTGSRELKNRTKKGDS